MWSEKLGEILPLLGHRNWILIVDKAFPLQSAAGMTYIDTGEEITDVLDMVLQDIEKSVHLKPVIYRDRELEFLTEELAPGAGALKAMLAERVSQYQTAGQLHELMHEEVFAKLDAASRLFSVIVLKTECTLPYTSVFIELDCGYWDAGRERILRGKIKQGKE